MKKCILAVTIALSHLDYLGALYGMQSGIMLIFVMVMVIAFCLAINRDMKREWFLKVSKGYWTLFLLVIAACIISAITIFWSNARLYGATKVIVFLIKFLTFWVAFPLVRNRANFTLIVFLGLSIANLTAIAFIFDDPITLIKNSGKFNRFGSETSNPIVVGRYFGFISTSCLAIAVYNRRTFIKITAFASALFGFLYLITTGSKGPVFGLIGATLVLVSIRLIRQTNRLFQATLVSIIILIVGIVGYLGFELVNENDLISHRFIYNEDSYESRWSLSETAIQLIVAARVSNLMLGHGLGNFGYVLEGNDESGYPHNLALELLYETGLIGLIPWIACLFYSLSGVKFLFISRSYKWMTQELDTKSIEIFSTVGLALTVYFLLNSMVSSDLSGNVYCFVAPIAVVLSKK